MVQNPVRRRGRPRAYDPDEALRRALETFWRAGYAGTSLDDLAAAMGMNRPSIYAAFGDKKALFLKAMELYAATSRAGIAQSFAGAPSLKDALADIVRRAIGTYTTGAFGPRGCFMAGAAITDAATEPEVASALDAAFHELEDVLAERFRRARAAGEALPDAPPQVLGRMVADLIYGLALRARAGAPQAELTAAADAALAVLTPAAANVDST